MYFRFLLFIKLVNLKMKLSDKINIEEKENYYYFHLHGKFVGEDETDFLEKQLDLYANANKNKVIIDLSDVNYFSSIALGILLKQDEKFTKSNGKIVICCVPDFLANIFVITKTDSILNISNNLEFALNSLNR